MSVLDVPYLSCTGHVFNICVKKKSEIRCCEKLGFHVRCLPTYFEV